MNCRIIRVSNHGMSNSLFLGTPNKFNGDECIAQMEELDRLIADVAANADLDVVLHKQFTFVRTTVRIYACKQQTHEQQELHQRGTFAWKTKQPNAVCCRACWV